MTGRLVTPGTGSWQPPNFAKKSDMPADIKCPNCGHEFEPNDVIREEVEKELRSKAAEWQKKKTEEFQQQLQKKELEHQQVLQSEKLRLQQQLEETLRRNISAD